MFYLISVAAHLEASLLADRRAPTEILMSRRNLDADHVLLPKDKLDTACMLAQS